MVDKMEKHEKVILTIVKILAGIIVIGIIMLKVMALVKYICG